MKPIKNCATVPCSFTVNDTTIYTNYPLYFRKNLHKYKKCNHDNG